ncbi:hypothetical protein EsDP_00005266 [Epichloe bromicola]|uniref:Uncharacterized protein n=1 Tax=Epichloe bromicola TaxID=79588 RepID=A0ABQ0CU65_9HYPO
MALLAALTGAQAQDQAASSETIVACEACKSVSSTPDMVTRSPLPTTPCTAPALVVVSATGGAMGPAPTSPGGNSTAPMPVPVAGAATSGLFMGASGLIALAVGVVVMV